MLTPLQKVYSYKNENYTEYFIVTLIVVEETSLFVLKIKMSEKSFQESQGMDTPDFEFFNLSQTPTRVSQKWGKISKAPKQKKGKNSKCDEGKTGSKKVKRVRKLDFGDEPVKKMQVSDAFCMSEKFVSNFDIEFRRMINKNKSNKKNINNNPFRM